MLAISNLLAFSKSLSHSFLATSDILKSKAIESRQLRLEAFGVEYCNILFFSSIQFSPLLEEGHDKQCS